MQPRHPLRRLLNQRKPDGLYRRQMFPSRRLFHDEEVDTQRQQESGANEIGARSDHHSQRISLAIPAEPYWLEYSVPLTGIIKCAPEVPDRIIQGVPSPARELSR